MLSQITNLIEKYTPLRKKKIKVAKKKVILKSVIYCHDNCFGCSDRLCEKYKGRERKVIKYDY